MRTFSLCILALFTATCAAAQSPKDAEQTFRAAVLNQPALYMRGFPGDNEVYWKWNGTAFVIAPSKYQEFSALRVNRVDWKRDRVDIYGARESLTKNNAGHPLVLEEKDAVHLVVDLRGAPSGTAFPNLVEVLFYADQQAALTDLPSYIRKNISSSGLRGSLCDCNTDSCRETPPENRVHKNFPKAVHIAEPEYSEEALKKKFSGNVGVGVQVDEKGTLHDLWVVRPVGQGLDQQAAATVAQYRLTPATCHGEPVDDNTFIDISFQIF